VRFIDEHTVALLVVGLLVVCWMWRAERQSRRRQ